MSCFLFLWVLFIWMACSLGPRTSWVLLLSALPRQKQSQDRGLGTGLCAPYHELSWGPLAFLVSPTPTMLAWEVVAFSPSSLEAPKVMSGQSCRSYHPTFPRRADFCLLTRCHHCQGQPH